MVFLTMLVTVVFLSVLISCAVVLGMMSLWLASLGGCCCAGGPRLPAQPLVSLLQWCQ